MKKEQREQMRLRRQVIDHGEEVSRESAIEKGGTYAVWQMNDRGKKEWGLVVLKKSGMVKTYNVAQRGKWSYGERPMDHLRFFEPSAMELDFANTHEAWKLAVCAEDRAYKLVKMYEESRWHRVAEALRRFFSV